LEDRPVFTLTVRTHLEQTPIFLKDSLKTLAVFSKVSGDSNGRLESQGLNGAVVKNGVNCSGVLAKTVRALCPGGWIVVEDVDYVSGVPSSDLGAVEHEHTQSVQLREFAASGISH
jgi:hypothetical protein